MTDLLSPWRREGQMRLIQQSEVSECGLACLAMVAGFFGHDVDLNTLRARHSLSMRGTSLKSLMGIAQEMRLQTRAVRVSMDELPLLTMPAILHWDMKHFVVLKRSRGRKFEIYDPAHGVRHLSEAEVSELFTGVAIELLPGHGFEKKKERVSLRVSDLWGQAQGLLQGLSTALALALVLQLLTLMLPIYMQAVVDQVLPRGDMGLLNMLAICFAGIVLFQFAAQILRGRAILYLGSSLSFQVIRNLFHHFIRLPVSFFQSRHVGDLVSRFGSTDNIRQIFTDGVVLALVDGAMAVLTLILMAYYSLTLTIVSLAAAVIYLAVRIGTFDRHREYINTAIRAKAEESSHFMETSRGIETIKLFAREEEREQRWVSMLAGVVNASIRQNRFSILYQALSAGIFAVELIVVVFLAARLVMAGNFTVGMMMAYIAYRQSFSSSVASLIDTYIKFRELDLHLERVSDIVLSSSEEEEGHNAQNQRPLGTIELRDLAFSYPGSEQVLLQNVNCRLERGRSYAITGRTGSGKTTLLKLMTGLQAPTKGMVLVDGRSLSRVGLRNWRRHIGVVMQEDALFAGSLADNIAFFDTDIDMEQVMTVCRIAQVHAEIMQMPMQYETLVGDMGSVLSGGQKQRILLARALYHRPRVLFMDEGTANLDIETEKQISGAIAQLDITRVLIAHRTETIMSADEVLVLENGTLRHSAQEVRSRQQSFDGNMSVLTSEGDDPDKKGLSQRGDWRPGQATPVPASQN